MMANPIKFGALKKYQHPVIRNTKKAKTRNPKVVSFLGDFFSLGMCEFHFQKYSFSKSKLRVSI